ncbi:C40 family peptidase [Runella sp.]|jgi:cell wall-associated NlpC family hydrolase|uniref:C40 family peptidase n=1 Tax=Runella sp. TaxID=1960881 RepID=UPI002613D4C6|nr:C40 family peptidase [Runella sp.]
MKKIVFALLLLAGLSQSISAQSLKKDTIQKASMSTELLTFAKKHLSLRYRSGGTSRKGFDCSGFVRYCFSQFGMLLPHSSAAQISHGIEIALGEAKEGDLIFFKGHNAGSQRVGHVGLILDVKNNYVKFIHSAWKGGVRYDFLHADYYKKRFVGVRRVIR